MPTASQFKILRKMGCDGNVQASLGGAGGTVGAVTTRITSARALGLQRAAEVANEPIYVPPLLNKGFSDLKKDSDMKRARAMEEARENGNTTFFPDMVSMATLVSRNEGKQELSADDIMKRLEEMGWRKEGEAQRLAEEKKKRDEERRGQEEEEASKKREVLDLVNDPILRRVKEKIHQVPKHVRAPDIRPFAVCFDLLGPSVAHSTVKMKLDQLFRELNNSDVKMTTIEYQPRAMHTRGQSQRVGNRWVITLDSLFGASYLDGSKMYFGKQEVQLGRYDDVMTMEYKAFTRQTVFKKQFNMG
ncbi:uncharacterized protein [Littorina saxatilis]|uniref:Uncharacterized protein n=1 Tax=Littorina saxatilis TaxID=31220 RepID=A0AAN9BJT2_9CAEN